MRYLLALLLLSAHTFIHFTLPIVDMIFHVAPLLVLLKKQCR